MGGAWGEDGVVLGGGKGEGRESRERAGDADGGVGGGKIGVEPPPSGTPDGSRGLQPTDPVPRRAVA